MNGKGDFFGEFIVWFLKEKIVYFEAESELNEQIGLILFYVISINCCQKIYHPI